VIEEDVLDRMRLSVGILLILSCGWLGIRLLKVVEYEIIRHHLEGKSEEDVHVRSLKTHLAVFKKLALGIIITVTIGAIIMSFDKARQLGMAILASAGVFGLVIGLSATPAIENAITSLQLAVTQPIRIGDVVTVEGEWGRIEEITSCYVVVVLWDQRRLICPLTRFTKQSFQNWTRNSAAILGTIFFYVNYRVDVDPLRVQLKKIASASQKWDKRVCELVVTDCKEKALELRALISAKNDSDIWDLKCEIREKLIQYLQKEQPNVFPNAGTKGKKEKELPLFD